MKNKNLKINASSMLPCETLYTNFCTQERPRPIKGVLQFKQLSKLWRALAHYGRHLLQRGIGQHFQTPQGVTLTKSMPGAWDSEDLQSLVMDPNHRCFRLAQRYEDDNPLSDHSTHSRSAISDDPQAQAKPPKIELPTVDGNPVNWAVFWERFHSIIQRVPGLSDADKVTYF